MLIGGQNVHSVFHTYWTFNWYQSGYICLISLPKCDLWPLVFITMDGALYASMHVLDVDDCSMPCVCENAMPCVCENASMSVYILMIVMTCYLNHWVLLIFQMTNSSRKMLRSFKRIGASYFVKMMIWLLSSMNPINWLRNIRILLKILLKSWKSLNVWIWTWMLNLFCLTNLLMILNVKMNLLKCMLSVWLLNLYLKRIKIFVAIMLWYPILCLLCVLPQRTNQCTFLHIKEIKRWREKAVKSKLPFKS